MQYLPHASVWPFGIGVGRVPRRSTACVARLSAYRVPAGLIVIGVSQSSGVVAADAAGRDCQPPVARRAARRLAVIYAEA